MLSNTRTPSRPRSASTNRIRVLEEEMARLRSVLISLVGEDDEGQYRPEFVRDILARASDKPTHTFKNAKTFLRQLRED